MDVNLAIRVLLREELHFFSTSPSYLLLPEEKIDTIAAFRVSNAALLEYLQYTEQIRGRARKEKSGEMVCFSTQSLSNINYLVPNHQLSIVSHMKH